MVKYVILSLGVAGLLVFGQGGVSQSTWPTSQQERFVARVPQDFPTIQAAIDAVAEGGTVLIGPGTYQENLKITKSLRLIGAGQGIVRIQPKDDPFGPPPLFYGPPAIEITTEGEEKFIQIYLAHFSLERPEGLEMRDGISLGTSQALVQDVAISGYYNGLVGGRNVILSRVSFYRNATGVWSGSLTVHNSLFDGNGVGIQSFFGDLEVRQSLFMRNSVAIGILDWWSSRERELIGNVMMGNKVGLYLALGPTSDIQEKLKADNQPELGPSLMIMMDNEIAGNTNYGIALAHSGCLNGELFVLPPSLYTYFARQKVLVAFWERNNTIRDNGKGDLCPPDYPWPPGFRKP